MKELFNDGMIKVCVNGIGVLSIERVRPLGEGVKITINAGFGDKLNIITDTAFIRPLSITGQTGLVIIKESTNL